ncbi:unnamed protein product [Adineta ricciae]|uniref:Uncharacterized protein n=1 Tax=Adineta ricciae TaxID=249248 RepID=A0A813XJU1_ADIRI|nr:unnamed protein product [Adineta ricciae]
MAYQRELELRHRRDEILHETADLTSHVVQSLEQQQKFAQDTKENLHQQNLLLSLANDKMRSMNQDLTSVVKEMNEIDSPHGCLCCKIRKKRTKKVHQPTVDAKSTGASAINTEKPTETTRTIPELIDDNEYEKQIVSELNQMKKQLILFQDQVKTINRTFDEGDKVIHQFENETDQYMDSITTALNKAEHVLGRKIVVDQDKQKHKEKV